MLAEKFVLENPTPLRKSRLWKLQRDLFSQEGINAWNGKVPFYVTSNPYIANAYANTIIRYIQDQIRANQYNPVEPFYIVELGAGSGTFSFYILKRLIELQQELLLPAISFVYIMSDYAEKSLAYWSEHPALQTYIAKGILDFALYDITSQQPLKLIRSNKYLSDKPGEQTANPLIIIANYMFDSIQQDAFRIHRGKLQEGLVELSTAIDKAATGQLLSLADVTVKFSYSDTVTSYYQNADFDIIFDHYLDKYKDGNFLIPIGALNCIQYLRKIANHRLLVLVTDEGPIQDFASINDNDPDIALHTSFSLLVNFYAIEKYFSHSGGSYAYQQSQQAITSAIYLIGSDLAELPETRLAFKTFIDSGGPGNLYTFYRQAIRDQANYSIEALLAALSIMHWDPHFFNLCFKSLINKIDLKNIVHINDLVHAVNRIKANYYYLPNKLDTLINIGFLLQHIKHYKDAIACYAEALSYFSKVETIYYNLGICYYHLQEYELAKRSFESAVSLNPDNLLALGWFTKLVMQAN